MSVDFKCASAIFTIWLIVPYLPADKGQLLGPSDITLKRFEKCGEDGLDSEWNFAMRKVNRTHMGIDVDLKMPFAWDEEFSMNFTTSKWGDGGWKPNVLDVYDKDFCKIAMKYAGDKVKEIFKRLGQPEKCPLAPGRYILKDYIFDGQPQVPTLYGEFRVDIIFHKKDIQVSCLSIFANAAPKNLMAG